MVDRFPFIDFMEQNRKDQCLTLFARMMAKKAVTAWINTKYCPECGCLRTEHAVGCVFPAMMEPLEAE